MKQILGLLHMGFVMFWVITIETQHMSILSKLLSDLSASTSTIGVSCSHLGWFFGVLLMSILGLPFLALLLPMLRLTKRYPLIALRKHRRWVLRIRTIR